MTLEQYAYFAEIVGVVVIVITLLFLAVQLRQGTGALRSAAAHSIQEQISAHYSLLISDAEMTEIFLKGTREPTKLSETETGRYMAWLTVSVQAFQNIYYQNRRGAYEPGLFDGFMRLFAGLSSTPGFNAFWKARSYAFSAEFQQYAEAEIFTRADPEYQPLSVPAPVGRKEDYE